MKYQNKYIIPVLLLIGSMVFTSCDDKLDVRIPYPEDITFNELELGRFTFDIPNAPFEAGDAASGMVTVNVNNNGDGTYSGFALSNKNWRSFPWSLSDLVPGPLTPAEEKAAIDSTIFSVSTTNPNRNENFLVGCVENDDAFITIEKPSIVEHVLVANTTYNNLLAKYGSVYSGTYDEATQAYLDGDNGGATIRNIEIANTSTSMYSTFHLSAPDGSELVRLQGHEVLEKRAAGAAAAQATRDDGGTDEEAAADSVAAYNALSTGYVKLTIEGSMGGASTGSVDFYLAVRPNVDAENPQYDYIASDWFKVDLTSLGTVDRLLFTMSSSYVDGGGQMLVPPYFCLDGIRLKK